MDIDINIFDNGCLTMKRFVGVHVMVQWLINPNSVYEDAGLIPDINSWVKDPALP